MLDARAAAVARGGVTGANGGFAPAGVQAAVRRRHAAPPSPEVPGRLLLVTTLADLMSLSVC
jgi:predicted nucleic acid-binding Zn ribbon protein